MPTYEYECSKCGHEMEAFQSMKDAPLRKCPACGRLALRRKIGSGAGLIFKGSGFYITDYKKKHGGGHKHGESQPAEGKASASSSPKSTPQPAASTPAAR